MPKNILHQDIDREIISLSYHWLPNVNNRLEGMLSV